MLLLVRVAIYAFPVAFLLANGAVLALPFVFYLMFVSMLRGYVTKFLSVLFHYFFRSVRTVLVGRFFLIVDCLVRVLDPLVYKLQY